MHNPQLLNLPLFPLSVVLFPYLSITLRIFEQRYLTMIAQVLKTAGVFGVVPILKGREVGEVPEIYAYGTLVSIHDWHRLSDGLLGISVMGEQCFRVVSTQTNKQQLLIGSATLLVDEQPSVSQEEELRELLALLPDHALFRRLGQAGEISSTRLSWLLAASATLPQEIQMQLLTITDSGERIRIIRNALVNRRRFR